MGYVVNELSVLAFPLLAPAVQQFDIVEPPITQQPVPIGSEPVVVASVKDHRRLRGNSTFLQELRQTLLVYVLSARFGVEVIEPVPRHRVAYVALLVRRGVLVNFDDADRRVVEVRGDPIGLDKCTRMHIVSHLLPPLFLLLRVAPLARRRASAIW